jgi:hypothetical protein
VKANGATRSPQHALPVVILGTDAALAAAPATPVQLAHACLRAGFASVIPANWGDELIAAGVVRRLADRGPEPAIQCSCPIVAHRLLSVSGDLRHVLIPLISPPVAVARYVRALSQPGATRITYVGACPGALDESIDIRMTPAALLELLAERQIVPEDQPRMFESVLPPDRRRFWSQPGGLPAPEVLWRELDTRTLVEITSDDIPSEVAQHLLSGKPVLIDAATRLGCLCSGAGPDVPPLEARGLVTALEPPRSTSPIIEDRRDIELDLPVPATSRTPVDVIAVVEASSRASHSAPPEPAPPIAPQPARNSPIRGVPVSIDPRPARGNPAPPSPRPVLGGVPVTRDGEGRTLPRAYVARRRPSPKSNPVVPPHARKASTETPRRSAPHVGFPPQIASAAPPPPPPSGPAPLLETVDAPRASALTAAPVVGLAAVHEERAVPLTATSEPVRSALTPATSAAVFESHTAASPTGGATAAAGPASKTSPEAVADTGESRRSRETPRDLAAVGSRVRADERRALRRQAGIWLLKAAIIGVIVVASVATGVVVGQRLSMPAPASATP